MSDEIAKKKMLKLTEQAKTMSAARIKKVAEVARLELSEDELKKFSGDLNNILIHFKILQKADTKNVEPSFQPLPMKNVLREDRVEKGLSQEEALANARLKEKGYFKGPRAV